MSDNTYQERFRRFTEACDQLRPLQELHHQEAMLKDEEVGFETMFQDLKERSKNAVSQMVAAQEANADLDRPYTAVGAILTVERETKREYSRFLEEREQILNNNRPLLAQEYQFLKDCARRLVEVNPLFEKVVKEEWLAVEDSIEEQAESIAGYDDSEPGHSRSQSSHGREEGEPSAGNHVDSATAPAAHLSEGHDDSDDNPFLSDDETAEVAKRSSRVQSRSSPCNPSAEDHPMEDGDQNEENPRASSETLGREPVRSATLPHEAAEMQRGPQTPRGTVQPEVEDASRPQTGEQSRRRTKKRKRLSAESGAASEHENDGKPRAKTNRRKQDQIDKPGPIIKRIKHHRLVSTSSITMAELSKSFYRHFITQDSESRFCIIRCDVCGVHFHEGAAGGLRHLNLSPHHVSLKSSKMPHGAKNDHVFRYMAIRVVDCSLKIMEDHNAKLKWDIQALKYKLRSAINPESRSRKDCYHPEHPAILLPRAAESNRPRLTPGSNDGSSVARSSSPPQPQNDQRPHGFTPGQVYWVKQYSAKHYRVALALPPHDFKEIGLPRWSVLGWTDKAKGELVYDDAAGCYLQPSRPPKDNIWHPMLYLDLQDGRTDPEVVFINLPFVRAFERDEIGEDKPTFARVYEYLDHARLWFMAAEPEKEEAEDGENTSLIHTARSNAQGARATDVIEIGDDSDGEELPPVDVVIDRTPTKPKPESAKKSQKGKERDTRPWVGGSSESRGYTYTNPPPGLFSRQTRQSTLGVEQEVGPTPEATMGL